MPPKNPDPSPPKFQITVDYLSTGVSAWLIPGAGHWLLGYRLRGALLGASILGLFWFGQAFACPAEGAENRAPMAVSRKVSPVFFACQVGNGFSTLVSEYLWGKPRYKNDLAPLDRFLPRHLNLGILATSISGLLNMLVVLHILDPKTWAQAALDKVQRPSPPPDERSPGTSRGGS